MILKAKERGGGRQLGLYLLKLDTNEHVHVHELRGFVSDDLPSALQEIDAIGRGTKAKNLFFSLSLNPPPNERVSADQFESAVDAVERKLGLDGQPRVIVFHEVDGRRHAHAVWSRIDAKEMKAINLSFYKTKLRDVGRELFLKHGWQMPPGYVNSKERDPLNYTLPEWQQAKRAGHDPKALKEMFRECWAASDSARAFAAALKMRGLTLARGDSRGHVAVDYKGEVYAIARYTGQKTKDVRARLGDLDALPSVNRAMIDHANGMSQMLRRHIKDAEEHRKRETEKLALQRKEIVERQRNQRAQLEQAQQTRLATETRERTSRFSRGFRGLWHRLTGKHSEIKRQNEHEALLSPRRDKAEKDKLIFRQLEERQCLHHQIKQTRQEHREQVAELHRDIAGFERTGGKEPPRIREHFQQANRARERIRSRDVERGHEPDFER